MSTFPLDGADAGVRHVSSVWPSDAVQDVA
jgi:hypothetical protein